MSDPKILVATVGIGNVNDLDNTLFSPFLKTLMAGRWKKVILVCSQQSAENAARLRERHPDLIIETKSLPESGDEANLDRSFTFCDRLLRDLVDQGSQPADITVDYTRGTKVMSAAVVLAGISHGVRSYRYIDGEKRDADGKVIAGTEKLAEVCPDSVFRAQRQTLAFSFIKEGQFGVIRRLLAGDNSREAQWLKWAADFWGSWDRFHYKQALKIYQNPGARPGNVPPTRMAEFWPTPEQVEFLKALSRAEPGELPAAEQADATRRLAADLVQNAARRLREGQTEEVLVRLYRLVELAGQIRLFVHGIDSGDARREDPRVAEFVQSLENPPREYEGGRYELAREHVVKLLERLGDPFAGRLADLSWLGLNVKARNRSILIHGFKARSASTGADALARALTAMRELLEQECSATREWVEVARFKFLPE